MTITNGSLLSSASGLKKPCSSHHSYLCTATSQQREPFVEPLHPCPESSEAEAIPHHGGGIYIGVFLDTTVARQESKPGSLDSGWVISG